MSTLNLDLPARRVPAWLWAAAACGVAWNLFGVVQFIASLSQTLERLMAAGLSEAQAEIYLALPAWVTAAFAIGVFGGLCGSIALVLRRNAAVPIFAGSLAGCIALFAADVYHGVFAAVPSQLVTLAAVVLIAAALLWVSWRARRQGLLS